LVEQGFKCDVLGSNYALVLRIAPLDHQAQGQISAYILHLFDFYQDIVMSKFG
jgi:hypothetical protein